MHRSSSSTPRSVLITSNTTLTELRQALPEKSATVYASKMSESGSCTLYFAPNNNAKASRVHAVLAQLIGSGSQEKRFAFLKIKQHATKELTTDFMIGILDELQRPAPQTKLSDASSSFSSFSDLESQSQEDASTSFSSFSQVSLSEDADKENKPINS